MSKCKSCGAEILFIKTSSGKMMPVNAEPMDILAPENQKEIVISASTGKTLRAEDAKLRSFDGRNWHTSHFATCPDAGKFRKKNLRERGSSDSD